MNTKTLNDDEIEDFDFLRREKAFDDCKEYLELIQVLDYYIDFFKSFSFSHNSFLLHIVKYEFTNIDTNVDLTDEKEFLRFFYEYRSTVESSRVVNLDKIFQNSKNCLFSIKSCIKYLNLSDAYTLFRKFKDDLFIAVFMLRMSNRTADDYKTSKDIKNWNKNVDLVFNWTENKLSHFYYSKPLELLLKDSNLVDLDNQIKFSNYFTSLTRKLNNYAHSNGVSFINDFNPIYNRDKTVLNLVHIKDNLEKSISILFIFIFYIDQSYLSSSDYLDYMSMGIKPPNNCQYYVAPYLQNFLNKTVSIHPELKKFLIKTTCMNIE